MTAAQRRSLKKEKKRKKQAAKVTPAAQPQMVRHAPSSDGVTENENEEVEGHKETPDQTGNSTIAEDIIAAAAAADIKSTSDDDNDSESEASQTSSHLPDGKLRWAYVRLEKCLDRKEEPPAWLLRFVMKDVDYTKEPFERLSGCHNAVINSELTTVDQLPANSTHSLTNTAAGPFTQVASAASATDRLSSANQPPSVERSLSTDYASGTNAENLSNNSIFEPAGQW